MNIKHKGFTLIELVILLVMIGVLAVVMALVTRNSESSSKATHIIHDFRNLKTVAMSWHKDNGFSGIHDRKEILTYLNNNSMVKVSDAAESGEGRSRYILKTIDGGKSWYVGCELNDAKTRGKLTAKANTLKLLGSDMKSVYNNDPQVWVQVLPDRTGS